MQCSHIPASALSSFEPAKRELHLVLDNVHVTTAGELGGYFYEVYLNFPQNRDPSTNEEKYPAGSFGPFEVSSALHMAAKGPAILIGELRVEISADDVE